MPIQPQLACMVEHHGPIRFNMFAQSNARLCLAKQLD